MARNVYFAFDYDDVKAANIVRNSDVVRSEGANGTQQPDLTIPSALSNSHGDRILVNIQPDKGADFRHRRNLYL